MRQAIVALIAAGLAGCATTDGSVAPDQAVAFPDPEAIICDAAPAQYHIGHEATQGMGAAILRDSGARTLRWGPPNAVWTMDHRRDRVNVEYDAAMKIVRITCG